jgi:hypothetical protein
MNDEQSGEHEIFGRIEDLLAALKKHKPDDRSELDKVYAIAITDVQRLWAWWNFAFDGMPPYVQKLESLPPYEG